MMHLPKEVLVAAVRSGKSSLAVATLIAGCVNYAIIELAFGLLAVWVAQIVVSGVFGVLAALVVWTVSRIGDLNRDGLTQCLMRHALEDQLLAIKKGKRECTIAFVDINGLGRVNTTSGHHTGDRLLKYFGGILLDAFGRTTNTGRMVARLGGDEFVIVCTYNTNPHDFADEIAEVIGGPNPFGDWPLAVGGVATTTYGRTALGMHCADLAMYAAKAAYKAGGAAKVVAYDPDLHGVPAESMVRGVMPPVRPQHRIRDVLSQQPIAEGD